MARDLLLMIFFFAGVFITLALIEFLDRLRRL